MRSWLSRLPLADVAAARPTPVEQLFIFQTLLGVWPISEERLAAYLEKAMREAKQHTTWVEPDEAHEAAVQPFARALLTHRDFLRTFEPFQREVAEAGDRAALGQLLLKLTVPGMPDIYQGDELLCLSLVDPDNRRPVDWDERRAALARPAAEAARSSGARWRCGRAARGFAGPTSRSRPARTPSRSCAAATCSSRSGCAASGELPRPDEWHECSPSAARARARRPRCCSARR